MAGQQYSGPGTFGRRVEKWVRDSAELRAWVQQARGLGAPATPEEAALRRYQRSRAGETALPHPSVSPLRYQALTQRHRQLSTRLALALILIPLLIPVAVLVGPVAVQAAVAALAVPLAALAWHDTRALARLESERHLSLRGGLADAWADWVKARETVESLDNAAQARAALGANEARMQSLVLALSRAEARPGHQDTEDHRASRDWVYRTAAQATALAQAERELELTTQAQVDAGDLRLAPEGDPDALEQALDAAREITRQMKEPPHLT